MSPKTQEIMSMLDMLPEQEQNLAYEMIKRFVLAWDPDFTKLTEQERHRLERAEAEIKNGDYVDFHEIDW